LITEDKATIEEKNPACHPSEELGRKGGVLKE